METLVGVDMETGLLVTTYVIDGTNYAVRHPYYLASCDECGWIGSSEKCGTDDYGDDSDVYCPRCYAAGADCGMIAREAERNEIEARQEEGQ